jgi:hypothetical protein
MADSGVCISPACARTPSAQLPSCQVQRGVRGAQENAAGNDSLASLCRGREHSPKKSVEQPKGERQANAHEERSHEWRMNLEAWLCNVDVTRQTPEPAQLIGSKPEHQAYDRQENANADKHFAKMCHRLALRERRLHWGGENLTQGAAEAREQIFAYQCTVPWKSRNVRSGTIDRDRMMFR